MSYTRKTSIDSYNKIKSSGLLSKLRFKVYDALFIHGPLTQGELCKYFFSNVSTNTITPRFAELSSCGVIECVGDRPCRVTGIKAMVWDVNDRLPTKPVKKKSKLEIKIQEAVMKERLLCAEIARRWDAPLVSQEILNRE